MIELKADLVLKNGIVYSIDKNKNQYSAIAIKKNKVIYTGDNHGVEDYIDENTSVIDLGGKLVLPGFMDGHMHPTIGGPSYMYEIVLNGVVGFDNVMQTIRDFVAEHKDETTYGGYGFIRTDYDEVGPRKEWLDEIVPDKPVVIYSDSGHSAWVNSKALEMAGIDKNTKAPVGAEIAVDPKTGEPAGLVKGLEYIKIFDPIKPQMTVEKMKAAYVWLFKWFNREGLTSVVDAEINLENLVAYNAYKELAEEGKMHCRVRGTWMITESVFKNLEENLDKAKKLSEKLNTPYFKMNAVKVFADGVIEEATAYMSQPYANREDGWCGEPAWSDDQLKKIFIEADKRGFQLHVHQIGDAAAKQVLDAFEYVQEVNGNRDSRHTMAHLQCVNDEDIKRMGELGVEAVVSPEWSAIDLVYYNFYKENVGQKNADNMEKLRTYIDNGVRITSHCDFNVSDPEIDLRVYSGVVRTIPQSTFEDYYGGQGYTRTTSQDFVQDGTIMGPYHPEEAITTYEVIESCTINPAAANFMENEIGSIEVGKFADLVIYDNNFMEYTFDEMEKICGEKPCMTIFDGNIIYTK